MKRSITFALATAAVAFALSGCSAGLYTQTADQTPTVPGANVTVPGRDGVGTLSVRNATLAYPGTEGYKAGSQAQAHIWLFNDTPEPVRVVIRPGLESPVTIPPGGFAKPEVRFPVDKTLHNDGSFPVEVEFVGVSRFNLVLPIAPPDEPAPKHKIELDQPAGSGH
ncbi:hypothetical protein [Allorhizocola rhizosphaerae]|uniref:hypothetical protein n=1 Tax=Allorhizocola rhizosphaerae TaxID=1872709 RepID=UPI000E3D15A7|nr:hypothetical protein [Allorhizocola rhizosphaerae]